MSRKTICAAAALALCACEAPRRYTVEEGVSAAQVRFTTNFGGGSTVFRHVKDLSRCPFVDAPVVAGMAPGSMFNPEEVSALTMIGTSGKPEKMIRERKVPAGQRLQLHAWVDRPSVPYVHGSYTCSLGVSFIPLADRQYEVSFVDQNKQCTVSVRQLTLGASDVVVRNPEPSVQHVRAFNTHDFCPK